MPTNVTPEYKKAEEAYRKAREPKERLEHLLLVLIRNARSAVHDMNLGVVEPHAYLVATGSADRLGETGIRVFAAPPLARLRKALSLSSIRRVK